MNTLPTRMHETAKLPLCTRSSVEVFAHLCTRTGERGTRTESVINEDMREIALVRSEWALHGLVECTRFCWK